MAARLDENVCGPLNFLLKAKSKDFVKSIIQEGYHYRSIEVPTSVIKHTSSTLDINLNEAEELLSSIVALVRITLYEGFTDPKEIYEIFPDNFHKNLKELLTRLLVENIPGWRSSCIEEQVSLPRLIDFDWRVDVKSSSDAISRMSIPSCIMQLKVQEGESHEGAIPVVRCLNVELTKEKLDTMLDGLGKIRDQLSSVAK